MKWKTLSSTYLTDFPYFKARKDKCETPDGKVVPEYYMVELPTTVCAMALTTDNEVLMVRQYRHPIAESILELPGGFVDQGETPEIAIRRELLEETGCAFSDITPVGKIAANPGVLNNYTYFFLAKGGKKVASQKLDEHEFLSVEKIDPEKLKEMLLQNKIVQSLHANCAFYALKELGMI